tara:strand:+ start:77 stop:379 length:303 start_codon:yes stop_codon:yes gene_type:complete
MVLKILTRIVLNPTFLKRKNKIIGKTMKLYPIVLYVIVILVLLIESITVDVAGKFSAVHVQTILLQHPKQSIFLFKINISIIIILWKMVKIEFARTVIII